MQTQATDYSDYGQYGLEDPNDVWQKVYDEGMTNADKQTNSVLRTSDIINNKFTAGFDPRVRQAQMLKGRMQQIMQEIGPQGSNEDPLDYQAKLAHAIAGSTADLNPQIAMAAVQQGAKVAQAKQQQLALSTDTSYKQSQISTDRINNAIKIAGGNYQVFDSGKDSDGMPSGKLYGDIIPMFDKAGNPDPDFTTNVSKALADAKASGAQEPSFGTVDNINNGKGTVAALRANAMIQGNYIKAMVAGQKAAAAANVPDKVVARGFTNEAAQVGQFSDSVDQFAQFYQDPANKNAATAGAHINTTLANWATNAASLGWDSMDEQNAAEKLLATQNPQNRAMITGLAWAIARAGIGSSNRLNFQEIKQAQQMIGDSPNPGILLNNLASLVDNKANQFQHRLSNLGDNYTNDAGLSQQSRNAQQGLSRTQDDLDKALKTVGMPAYKRMNGSSAAQATLPPEAKAKLQEGHVTTFGNGQKWTMQNGNAVQVP